MKLNCVLKQISIQTKKKTDQTGLATKNSIMIPNNQITLETSDRLVVKVPWGDAILNVSVCVCVCVGP